MKNLKENFLTIAARIVLFILLFAISNTIFSQTWPMPGATWRYCLWDWQLHPAGYLELGVVGDTMISGRTYTIIQFIGQSDQALIENQEHPMTLYTRYSNDTVYRFVNNREYLYFTYNLNVGDVFTTFRTAGWGGGSTWSDSACSSVLPLKVIEKSTVEYGGESLKTFVLRDTLFPYIYEINDPNEVEYTLVERIGVLNSYPLINTMEPAGNCYLPTDWGEAELGTYTDNSFEHFFFKCEGVGIDETAYETDGITLYPVPAKHFIEIVQDENSQRMYEISIYDLSGELLLNRKVNEKSYKLSLYDFRPGYYILVYNPMNAPLLRKTYPIIILR